MDMEIVKKYNKVTKQYNYNRNSNMYKGQMQGKVFVDWQVQFIQCSENSKYRPNFSKNNIIYRYAQYVYIETKIISIRSL